MGRFDKFGEFDTYEEFINEAKALFESSDTQAVRDLAKENGLDPDDAEAYITGEETVLTDPVSYAIARVNIEKETSTVEKPVAEYMATIARQVLAKGDNPLKTHYKDRHFKNIFEVMRKKAKDENKTYACGSDRDMEKIMEAYYLDSEKAMEKVVKQL